MCCRLSYCRLSSFIVCRRSFALCRLSCVVCRLSCVVCRLSSVVCFLSFCLSIRHSVAKFAHGWHCSFRGALYAAARLRPAPPNPDAQDCLPQQACVVLGIHGAAALSREPSSACRPLRLSYTCPARMHPSQVDAALFPASASHLLEACMVTIALFCFSCQACLPYAACAPQRFSLCTPIAVFAFYHPLTTRDGEQGTSMGEPWTRVSRIAQVRLECIWLRNV